MFDPDAGNLAFALSAVVDTVVVCGAIVWAARREPLGGRLAIALAAVGALLGLKLVLLMGAGLDESFGVLHVVWLDLTIVVPFAALMLLVLTRHRGGLALRLSAILAILLAPVGAYASFVEPGRLVVERAELRLPAERAGSSPVRIGVIADLQFERLGDHERDAVERLMAERPHVILLAGDYHQGSDADFERELPALRALLRQLRAPGGVYAVQGDVEGPDEAHRVMAGTGVRLLYNELVQARVGDRRLAIGGVDIRYESPESRAFSTRLERRAGRGDIRILFAHRPDVVRNLRPRTRVDLVVAGHTHGGQVHLPLVGSPVVGSRLPRDVAAGGLHTLGGRRIYVSRGVGVERGQAPRLRLGAPPEISVVTLR